MERVVVVQPKRSVVDLPVYQPGMSIADVKRVYGLDQVIKLASNENPYGSSSKVKQAMLAEAEQLNLYPDGAAIDLTSAVAKHYQVEPNQIIFGAGSDDVILMICRAYLVSGDETIMADQTFPQYKHNVEIEGAISIEVPMKDGTHDLEAMLQAVTEKTKIVWICNPNNPTGTIVSHQEIVSFMERIPSQVLVVLDEAYCEYVTDQEYPDVFKLLPAYNNLITLRTFSKIYGLASLRIGYGIGAPEVIHTINQVREPFNTTRMSQAAAIAAIEDQDFVQTCKVKNAEGIVYLQQAFERLHIQSFPAHGNFIMFDVKMPAKEMFELLLHEGYITRAGHKLYPNHLRVTVGTKEENEGLIAAIERILEKTKVTS
ncbi:histidinol-phosphate aminotransferase [Paenibacillus aquistagni]|uniref:Histidinol-phosphate aminotransferase n=1 Tax=Paenibacillus aquistagni TaxID=1852522 RepID=A0A1X7JHD7_9BACL|nr:histidinol-phosphate aminotransferase [Paenibacillus aquistagni]